MEGVGGEVGLVGGAEGDDALRGAAAGAALHEGPAAGAVAVAVAHQGYAVVDEAGVGQDDVFRFHREARHAAEGALAQGDEQQAVGGAERVGAEVGEECRRAVDAGEAAVDVGQGAATDRDAGEEEGGAGGVVVACEADGRQLGRQGAEGGKRSSPVGHQGGADTPQLAPEGTIVRQPLTVDELLDSAASGLHTDG